MIDTNTYKIEALENPETNEIFPERHGKRAFLKLELWLDTTAEGFLHRDLVLDQVIDPVEDGEEYNQEWCHQAVDKEGKLYSIIYWFSVIKGQELEDAGEFPWDDESRIISISPIS